MAAIHTFLVRLTTQAIRLLPRRVQGALDAWSRRVAHARALRRQRAIRPKD
ncbi:hypothetical protein [Ramlibacter sp. AN1133]|uniref:hypothetical protein n=1 Tax=Ramlibacter sp. AN1133 TaxID=3133429 RepID=UPI0030BEFDF0